MASRARSGIEAAPLISGNRGRPVLRRDVRAARARIDHYPLVFWRRWALRLLLAAPYALIAILINTVPGASDDTPNALLVERVTAIDWGRADALWLSDIMPPIPSLIALIVPNTLVLGIIGAVVLGSLLQRVIELMVQRTVAPPVASLLVIALAVNAITAYTAVSNLSGMLGLAFFGIGIAHAARFVRWGNTRSGFLAGIAFMLGTLSDSAGIASILAAALVVLFARHQRGDQPGARWANLLVLVYPMLAASTSLVMLAWVFAGSPFVVLSRLDVMSAPARFDALVAAVAEPRGWALLALLAVIWLAAIAQRSITVFVAGTLVFASQLAASVFGLVPEGSSGTEYILVTLVAIAFLPSATSLPTIAGLTAVGILLIIVGWFIAATTPVIGPWLADLGTTVGAVG